MLFFDIRPHLDEDEGVQLGDGPDAVLHLVLSHLHPFCLSSRSSVSHGESFNSRGKLLTSISWQFSSSLSSGLSPYIVTQSCSLISARLILLIVMRVVFLITVMAMMCCLASLAEWLWMVYWACCLVKRISEMIVPSQTDVRCQGGQKMIPTQS